MTEPTTGQMLDRYELVAPIARGGMGAVYLARLAGAGGFQRLFAIKLMHQHLADEKEFVDMLLDEARIAARLHHPNAVPIVDVCQSGKGFYLVMDYIDGVTLAKLLSAESLPWRDRVRAALRVILDALNGLHAAHELSDEEGRPLNLVHRDVSPQNILVGTDGVGRITDFGIALAASRIVASRPGLIKGKPSYMSPEQVMASDVDRRADVFPIGIILWEALTNHRLFKADAEVAAMMMVLNGAIERPATLVPEIPASLDAVCMKALERDASKRYPSAREMAAALETAAQREELLATSHEVADFLRVAFAEEFSQRKHVIREHVRLASQPRIAALSPETVASHIASQAPPPPEAGARPTGESGMSIPAIEVPPRTPSSQHATAPMPPASRSAHVRHDEPTARLTPSSRSVWIATAVALSLSALGGVYLFTRPPATPVAVHPTPSPVHPTAAPLTPVTPPVTPPTTPPAVVDPPVTPPVVPSVPVAVVPPVVAPQTPQTPPMGTPTGRILPRREERGARARSDAGAAIPARPVDPTIETNPYLHR